MLRYWFAYIVLFICNKALYLSLWVSNDTPKDYFNNLLRWKELSFSLSPPLKKKIPNKNLLFSQNRRYICIRNVWMDFMQGEFYGQIPNLKSVTIYFKMTPAPLLFHNAK